MKSVIVRRFGYAAVLVAFLASAQEPFRITTTEVVVPVTVTTPKGQFVIDLDKQDFSIKDNDQEQTITYFSREHNQPYVVGFLMDLSNNTKTQWKDYQSAAIDLVDTLLPIDKRYSGFLIGYATEPDLMVDTTNDPEKIVAALRKAKPGGGAALYDAIWEACTNRKLVQGEPREPRTILVVIGDGHDNASKKTLEEVLELVRRYQVTIYGVSTTSYGFGNDADDDVLVKLAEGTGGKVEYPLQNVYRDIAGYLEVPTDGGNYQYQLGTGGYSAAKANNIYRAIEHITGEINTQYILRYSPDIPPDSKNRRDIKVTVNLPNVKVRARPSYFPFGAPGSNTGSH
jgi:Ca-activated chloride channel family protein